MFFLHLSQKCGFDHYLDFFLLLYDLFLLNDKIRSVYSKWVDSKEIPTQTCTNTIDPCILIVFRGLQVVKLLGFMCVFGN